MAGGDGFEGGAAAAVRYEGPVKRVQETISLVCRRRGDHVAPHPSSCPRHGAYRIGYASAGTVAECFTICRNPSDRITQFQRQMSPRCRQQEQTQETPVADRKSPSNRRTKCQKTRLFTNPSTFDNSSHPGSVSRPDSDSAIIVGSCKKLSGESCVKSTLGFLLRTV